MPLAAGRCGRTAAGAARPELWPAGGIHLHSLSIEWGIVKRLADNACKQMAYQLQEMHCLGGEQAGRVSTTRLWVPAATPPVGTPLPLAAAAAALPPPLAQALRRQQSACC